MTISQNSLVNFEIQTTPTPDILRQHRRFGMFVNFIGYDGNYINMNNDNYIDELLKVSLSDKKAIETWFKMGGKKLQVWKYEEEVYNPDSVVLVNIGTVKAVIEDDLTLSSDEEYTGLNFNGLTLLEGDLVIINNQTNTSNGLYVASENIWVVSEFGNTIDKLSTCSFVIEGSNIINYIKINTNGFEIRDLENDRTAYGVYSIWLNDFLDINPINDSEDKTVRQFILGVNNKSYNDQKQLYEKLTSINLRRFDKLPRYFYIALRDFDKPNEFQTSTVSLVYDKTNQNIWCKYLVDMDNILFYKKADYFVLEDNLGVAENIPDTSLERLVFDKKVGILDNIENYSPVNTYFINMVDSSGKDVKYNFVKEDIRATSTSLLLNYLITQSSGSSGVVLNDGTIANLQTLLFGDIENKYSGHIVNLEVNIPPASQQVELKTINGVSITYDVELQINRIRGTIKDSINIDLGGL